MGDKIDIIDDRDMDYTERGLFELSERNGTWSYGGRLL